MLGKHEHGHVRLNLAIEGHNVLMELEAPGADIVGFEHTATDPDEVRALREARTLLSKPFGLIRFPEEAGCEVEEASVVPSAGNEHEHPMGRGAGEHDAHGRHGDHDGQAGHMEFHASYILSCARPDKIRKLAFPIFRLFPRLRDLDMIVLTDRGQTAYEVGPDAPEIELMRLP
jgi:hypothetical protein